MDKIIDGIGNNILLVIAVVCYTLYEICALRKQPSQLQKYEELKLLNEMREKGIVTQEEFDDKKADLLS